MICPLINELWSQMIFLRKPHITSVVLTILYFTSVQLLYSQSSDGSEANKEDSVLIDKFFSQNDLPAFALEEITLMSPPTFETLKERYRYNYLRKKVLKIHPYAIKIVKILIKLDNRLSKIPEQYNKNKYTKVISNYLEEHYTDTLENMTTTEGYVLCKLTHRYTNKTIYEIISHYKSGWSAFWWNTTAYVFNIPLDEAYRPTENKRDGHIEYILQDSFSKGLLEEFNPSDCQNCQ